MDEFELCAQYQLIGIPVWGARECFVCEVFLMPGYAAACEIAGPEVTVAYK